MLEESPTLHDLIDLVISRTEEADDLACLATASDLARDLSSLSDRLVDHFVQQARDSGASWSQIGQQLGVTKQGAQQRFTGSRLEELPRQLKELVAGVEEKIAARSPQSHPGLLQRVRGARPPRLTAQVRRAVSQAEAEALRLRHAQIGAGHLLLALLDDEAGVASSTLRSVGMTREAIIPALDEVTEAAVSASAGSLPLAPGARRALEAAVDESAALKHSYVGTEHVLLGILREQGPVQDIFAAMDIDLGRLTDEVSSLLERL